MAKYLTYEQRVEKISKFNEWCDNQFEWFLINDHSADNLATELAIAFNEGEHSIDAYKILGKMDKFLLRELKLACIARIHRTMRSVQDSTIIGSENGKFIFNHQIESVVMYSVLMHHIEW